MISSIFYFADTEQEYLDNYNRRQVKPYTIVFCRDTHTLWKNGIKYSGDSAETNRQIEEALEHDVQPLIDQLQNAIDEANHAAELAYARLDVAVTEGSENLQELTNTVNNEKARLNGIVRDLSNNIQDRVQDMFKDSDWLEQNWPQGVTTWQSGWDESIDAYLTEVGYWDVDANGNKVTKWSKIQQSVNGISQNVNQITEAGGTLDTLKSGLEQKITAEGTARNQLFSQQADVNADTGEILKWMYSGLTTESGKNKTLADLSAMAKDGSTTGISTIGALVEKIPETDPNTGNPLTDNEGNIIYKKDNNGNYLYRSKASLSAALNNSLATMINEATDNSASSEIVTSVGDYIAGIKSQADATQSKIALLAGNENGDFSQILLKDDLEKAIGQIATKKGVGSGDVFTSVKKLEDGGYVSESGLDARVNDAISSFTVQATEHSAGGTLVSKLREDSEDMALLRTEIDEARGAYTTLAAKFNGSEAGVVAQVDDKLVHAGLVSKNQDGSYEASVYTKVQTDGAIKNATSGLVANSTAGAAAIFAKANETGTEIQLSADKINFSGSANFENAVKAVDLDVQGLTQSDVNGIVQAKLEEGNATFSGDVVAKTLTAGDPNAMHITTEEGEIKFVNADGVAVARFVTNGNGLEIFLLDENGDEFYLDWSNWSSSAEYEAETFYELRYDAVEEHASIERIQLYLSDGEYYTKPNPNSRLTQQLNLYERIDDKSSVINNYSSQYGENQQVIYLKTTAQKTTENYSSSCVQEIPISNVMTFKNVTVSSSGKQDTDIYVYATNFRMPEQPIPYTQFGQEINISNTSWKRVPQFISQPSTSVGTGCLVTIGEVIHNLQANTTIDAVKSCEVVTSLRPTSNRFTASVSYDSYPNQWNVVDN